MSCLYCSSFFLSRHVLESAVLFAWLDLSKGRCEMKTRVYLNSLTNRNIERTVTQSITLWEIMQF